MCQPPVWWEAVPPSPPKGGRPDSTSWFTPCRQHYPRVAAKGDHRSVRTSPQEGVSQPRSCTAAPSPATPQGYPRPTPPSQLMRESRDARHQRRAGVYPFPPIRAGWVHLGQHCIESGHRGMWVDGDTSAPRCAPLHNAAPSPALSQPANAPPFGGNNVISGSSLSEVASLRPAVHAGCTPPGGPARSGAAALQKTVNPRARTAY